MATENLKNEWATSCIRSDAQSSTKHYCNLNSILHTCKHTYIHYCQYVILMILQTLSMLTNLLGLDHQNDVIIWRRMVWRVSWHHPKMAATWKISQDRCKAIIIIATKWTQHILGLQQSRDIDDDLQNAAYFYYELEPVPTSMIDNKGDTRTLNSKSTLKKH